MAAQDAGVPTSTRIYSTPQDQLLVCCRSTDSGCLGCSQSQSRGTSSGMVPRSLTASITRTLHGPGADQVQWEHRHDKLRSCTCEDEFVTPERRLLLGVCVRVATCIEMHTGHRLEVLLVYFYAQLTPTQQHPHCQPRSPTKIKSSFDSDFADTNKNLHGYGKGLRYQGAYVDHNACRQRTHAQLQV